MSRTFHDSGLKTAGEIRDGINLYKRIHEDSYTEFKHEHGIDKKLSEDENTNIRNTEKFKDSGMKVE